MRAWVCVCVCVCVPDIGKLEGLIELSIFGEATVLHEKEKTYKAKPEKYCSGQSLAHCCTIFLSSAILKSAAGD